MTDEVGAMLVLDSSSPKSPSKSSPGTAWFLFKGLLAGHLGALREKSGVSGFGLRLSLREAVKGDGTGVLYEVEPLKDDNETGVFLRLLEICFCGVRATDCEA